MNKPTLQQVVIPNLVSDLTPAGVAHIVKTARLDYTVKQADLDAAAFYLTVRWPTPFKDTGYCVSLNLQVENAVDGRTYSLAGFSQDMSSITVAVLTQAPALAAVGDLICVHAIAIHD